MGKKHRKQSVADINPLGVNHAHSALTRFERKREKYVTSDAGAPADFDNYMISQRGFTLEQVNRMRLNCNHATLSLVYNHCHATPNLMDNHGFTPANIARIMRYQGGAHNLMAVFSHIETLKLYCDGNREKILALGSFTGASCSINALCSDMSKELMNTHGFTGAQLFDLVSRVGGSRKLQLVSIYAAELLSQGVSHADIISKVKQPGSAELIELQLKERLQSNNNAVVEPVAPLPEALPIENTQITNAPVFILNYNHPAAAPETHHNNNSNAANPVTDDFLECTKGADGEYCEEFQFCDLEELEELFNLSLVNMPPEQQATGQLMTTQWSKTVNWPNEANNDIDEDDDLGMEFELASAFKPSDL